MTGPVEHLVGDHGDSAAGPTLVVVAGLHGNERAALEALESLHRRLARRGGGMAGRVVLMVGNRGALAAGRRFLDTDLNRIWTDPQSLEGVGREAEERRELGAAFDHIAEAACGPPHCLDLHTSSAPSPPFVVGLEGASRLLAEAVGAPVVLGFDRFLDGMMISALAAEGWRAAAFEVGEGRHDGARVLARGAASVMAWLGLPGEGTAGRESLAEGEVSPELEVVYRHAIPPGAHFEMRPGWSTFDAVAADQLLAHQDGAPVRAPLAGRLLLPRYQDHGADGFFIAVER